MLTIARPKQTLDFQLEGEDTIYSLPYPKDLPFAYMERLAALEGGEDERAGLDLIRDIMEDYAPGAWGKTTIDGLRAILQAWADGGDLGES